MNKLTVSVLASAIAGALTFSAAPALAQSSPYDAPTNPSYPAPQSIGSVPSPAPTYASPGPAGAQRGSSYASPAPPAGRDSSSSASNSASNPVPYGTVIAATPVASFVTVRRQRCYDQPGVVRAQPSGLGAVIGAVVGGFAGNAIGAGAGRALATGAGVIGGAIAGGSIEAANAPTVPVTTTQCVYPATTESRIVGYDVVYEFNGQRYTTRTQQDPGPRIALDVRPAGATPDEIVRAAADLPAPVPYAAYPYPPAYPAYGYPAPVYVGPPVSIGFGFRGRWH